LAPTHFYITQKPFKQKEKKISFGQLSARCHPDNRLFHPCWHAGTSHCTYEAARNRRNLYSAFLRLLLELSKIPSFAL
jgi:hypothetical protein